MNDVVFIDVNKILFSPLLKIYEKNTKKHLKAQLSNSLLIKSFRGDLNDKELLFFKDFLVWIAKVGDDVRPVPDNYQIYCETLEKVKKDLQEPSKAQINEIVEPLKTFPFQSDKQLLSLDEENIEAEDQAETSIKEIPKVQYHNNSVIFRKLRD